MRYTEAVEFLYNLQKFGATLGLERTFKLAQLAGQPHHKLRFIHVAGTNGKGSTCAMLESIYRAAGYRTGLFTSPHLISFTERIQINRQPIPENQVARLVQQIRPLLAHFPPDSPPTFFEVITVMALLWFAEPNCDVVIWETGLGGRLDATNIVTPLASVITNIQRDHEKWLGHTLPEIAREKAGIIKPRVPILTATDSDEPWHIIRAVAAEKNAPIQRILPSVEQFDLPLQGPHQQTNAALAAATVRALQDQLPVAEHALLLGLKTVRWPGRFDRRGRFILDGAHNPDGARALRQTIQQQLPGRRLTFILGILRDKNIPAICAEIVPVAEKIFTVPIQSDRAAAPDDIAAEFRSLAPQIQITSCPSLPAAVQKTQNEPLTVITGSLHFIGEAMELLHLEPGPPGERGLNDWKATTP